MLFNLWEQTFPICVKPWAGPPSLADHRVDLSCGSRLGTAIISIDRLSLVSDGIFFLATSRQDGEVNIWGQVREGGYCLTWTVATMALITKLTAAERFFREVS